MGGTHVIIKKFEPAIFFDLISRERVTFACMPPTMINMALNHPIDSHSLARLPRGMRVGTAGSAPPLATIQGAQERFGWRVIQIYGLTETSPFLTVSKVTPHMDDWPIDERLRVQAKTGYAMIGVDIRVLNEQGLDVDPDGGEVEVALRQRVMAGSAPTRAMMPDRRRWFPQEIAHSTARLIKSRPKKDLIISTRNIPQLKEDSLQTSRS
jgi:fatty-acyl-CoA synthase